MEARKSKIRTGQQRGGGLRGMVTGFSAASRRRLMRLVGIVDQREALPLFVTLTYPGSWVEDGREWKRHLDVLSKRLKRRFPTVGFIWKLEAQRRGAPHYHLLVWGVSYAELLVWLSAAWYAIVDSGDVKHLVAGTQVQRIRSWRGVMSYASKYLAKQGEFPESAGWENVGRVWGVRYTENIPWADPVTVGATCRQVARFMRSMRRVLPKAKRRKVRNLHTALCVFVGSASFWLANLDGLLGPPF